MSATPAVTGVQSVERALNLLELLTDAGGSLRLTELAAASGLPMPTTHRLIGTLMICGYVCRESSHRYSLGPGLVRLGEAAGRAFGQWTQPTLARLAELVEETANLATLDRDMVIYIAQAQGCRSMRMFTEPGRRVFAHSTGVGKCLLAQLEEDEVRTILARTGMPAQTDRTITDPDALVVQLRDIQERGYAIDNNEQEIGVRCVATPVLGRSRPMALSVSGPDARMDDLAIERVIPIMLSIADELGSS